MCVVRDEFARLTVQFRSWVLLLTHEGLLTLSYYTLYTLLVPFFRLSGSDSSSNSSTSFEELCACEKLSDNLSRTGCEKLRGATAVKLAWWRWMLRLPHLVLCLSATASMPLRALARVAHCHEPRASVLAAARLADNTPQLEQHRAVAQARDGVSAAPSFFPELPLSVSRGSGRYQIRRLRTK